MIKHMLLPVFNSLLKVAPIQMFLVIKSAVFENYLQIYYILEYCIVDTW